MTFPQRKPQTFAAEFDLAIRDLRKRPRDPEKAEAARKALEDLRAWQAKKDAGL